VWWSARRRCELFFVVVGNAHRHLGCGNFAQRGDDFLIVGFDQWARALEQLLGTTRPEEHQLEPIRHLLQAIFNRDASHSDDPSDRVKVTEIGHQRKPAASLRLTPSLSLTSVRARMSWRERLARLVAGERGVITYEAIPELQQAQTNFRHRAQRLRRHAEQAPNQLNRGELTRLSEEDDARADEIGEALAHLGGTPAETPVLSSVGGSLNHWARLVEDLEAHRAAVRRLRERVVHFAESVPDVAAVFDRLYNAEEKHLVVLRDLIARTDPQAID